jgi:hypothetical protein
MNSVHVTIPLRKRTLKLQQAQHRDQIHNINFCIYTPLVSFYSHPSAEEDLKVPTSSASDESFNFPLEVNHRHTMKTPTQYQLFCAHTVPVLIEKKFFVGARKFI